MSKVTRNRVVIVSDGIGTQVFVNGKAYAEHITGIKFSQISNGEKAGVPELAIIADTLPVESSESIEDFERFLKHVMGEK